MNFYNFQKKISAWFRIHEKMYDSLIYLSTVLHQYIEIILVFIKQQFINCFRFQTALNSEKTYFLFNFKHANFFDLPVHELKHIKDIFRIVFLVQWQRAPVLSPSPPPVCVEDDYFGRLHFHHHVLLSLNAMINYSYVLHTVYVVKTRVFKTFFILQGQLRIIFLNGNLKVAFINF